MSTFVKAIHNQEARTENNMKAFKSTANACVDLFFKIGASRGQDIVPGFVAALADNEDYALRIAQWARDVRGGAGERQLYRDILSYLEKTNPEVAIKLIEKTPELGRWDDILIDYRNDNVRRVAYSIYHDAIKEGNGLAAKWAPRKGYQAKLLRKAWGMTPKQYRKTLVNLTNVVETPMCNGEWNSIKFDHVPSLAHARYRKAFARNAETYAPYVEALKSGEATIKASAVFPSDVILPFIKALGYGYSQYDACTTEIDSMIAQWDALPNFMGEDNILPMVDVSGSMHMYEVLHYALALGLYCADKNGGEFKDVFLTFSQSPELVQLKGNIYEKMMQMNNANWGMNTNLHAALDEVLATAKRGNVAKADMPKVLLVLSDMQFDSCVRFDDSAMEMIRRKYSAAGYDMPNIVFWNLRASDNVPTTFDQRGVALISGYSPSIMKTVLASADNLTPMGIMLDAIMNERYAI
jgi:hypothetical protein